MAEVVYKKEKGKDRKVEEINLSEFIAVKGVSAKGNKLTNDKINEINLLSPLPEVLITKEEVEEVIEEVIIDKQEALVKEEESKEEADESNKIVIDENSSDNQFKLEL